MKVIASLKGRAGEGWCTSFDEVERSVNPSDATLRHWLIYAPRQAIWSNYVVFGVHLRDIPGQPPPRKRKPENTHEIMIIALNPEIGLGASAESIWEGMEKVRAKNRSPFLTPINLAKQFQGTDEECSNLVDALAVSIIHGTLPAEAPLSGQDCWTEALEATILHLREGKHPNFREELGITKKDVPHQHHALEEQGFGISKTTKPEALEWPDCPNCKKVQIPVAYLPAFPSKTFLEQICRCA